MYDTHIGKVDLCIFSKPIKDYALCNGSYKSINQNTALFSLMGITYGGDGRTTFALPDLRGRVPIGVTSHATKPPQSDVSSPPSGAPAPISSPYYFHYRAGYFGGVEQVELNAHQLAAHTHQLYGSNAEGNKPLANTGRLLASPKVNLYSDALSPVALSTQSVGQTGGTVAHSNIQPTIAVCFMIALFGAYPSRS